MHRKINYPKKKKKKKDSILGHTLTTQKKKKKSTQGLEIYRLLEDTSTSSTRASKSSGLTARVMLPSLTGGVVGAAPGRPSSGYTAAN
jgi:hypothetical protein